MCINKEPKNVSQMFPLAPPYPFPRETVILTSRCVDILLALYHTHLWASLVAQAVKNLPEIRETQVLSLGWEDPPGRGNGYPIQYSCLGNPMDRGTWGASVHGVAKNQT